MKIDVSPLERAAAQLRRSLDYLHSDLARNDAGLREQFRAASIQAFEFTYELAVNMIRRQLAQISPNPDALRRMSFADLMRDAADAGIVRDARAYVHYREIRSRTSHAYNEEQAESVVAILADFRGEIDFLLATLRERNRATD